MSYENQRRAPKFLTGRLLCAESTSCQLARPRRQAPAPAKALISAADIEFNFRLERTDN